MTGATIRLGLAAMAIATAVPATADVLYRINGVFDDRTTLAGTLDINVYGFIGGAGLTTQTATPFTGFTYTPGDSSAGNTATTVDFQPGYTSDLHLDFTYPLLAGRTQSIGGFECQGSYSCYVATGGVTRVLTSATATVPEPATWALLIAGFGVVGMVARRRGLAAA